MTEKQKITAETNIAEILNHPGASEILANYQFPCLSCPLASFEISRLPLGLVTEKYQLPLDDILRDLNEGL
jgi:hypothetical protein